MTKGKKIAFIIGVVAVCVAGLSFALVEAGVFDKKVAEPTFEELVAEDFAVAHQSDPAFFYEVQVELNGNLDTLTADAVKPVAMTTVYCDSVDVFFVKRNLVEGTKDVEVVEHDRWMGSFDLESVDFPVTFQDAVNKIYETNFPIPAARFAVLRKPTNNGAFYPNPVYIFGQHGASGVTHYLQVDAVTGEVTIMGLDTAE